MWADGAIYSGEWFENKMHGEGKFVLQEGNFYTGTFVNDQKEGFGTFNWGDGR